MAFAWRCPLRQDEGHGFALATYGRWETFHLEGNKITRELLLLANAISNCSIHMT